VTQNVKPRAFHNSNQHNILNNDYFSRIGQGTRAKWRKYVAEQRFRAIERRGWASASSPAERSGFLPVANSSFGIATESNLAHGCGPALSNPGFFVAAIKEFLG
jgi:hypothetical protein